MEGEEAMTDNMKAHHGETLIENRPWVACHNCQGRGAFPGQVKGELTVVECRFCKGGGRFIQKAHREALLYFNMMSELSALENFLDVRRIASHQKAYEQLREQRRERDEWVLRAYSSSTLSQE
jgi:hypothetical protein